MRLCSVRLEMLQLLQAASSVDVQLLDMPVTCMRSQHQHPPTSNSNASHEYCSCRLAEGKIAEGWQECESSPYSWAEGKGGTHLHTMLMSDLNLLRPFAMLDSTFLATALLEIADHKANMVMEVSPFSGTSTVPRSDREAFHRQQGSVVVAAPTGNFSYDAAMSDFASAQVWH